MLRRQNVAHHEPEICGAFRQPAHEPRIPIAAVSDEHDGSAARAGETLLLGALDAVEHLHFKILLLETLRGCKIGQPPYQRYVMRAERGAHAAILLLSSQHIHAKFEIAFVNILLARKRDLWRLVVRPFDQADRRSQRKK